MRCCSVGSEVSTWPGCMFLSVPLLSVLGELRDAPTRHLRFKICREMVTSAQRSGTLSFASVASVPFGSSVRLCPVFWYSGHYATWFFPQNLQSMTYCQTLSGRQGCLLYSFCSYVLYGILLLDFRAPPGHMLSAH